MPNKTIYLNTINSFEKAAGFSFIDKEDLEKKIQAAWKQDATDAKSDFLDAYRKIFQEVIGKWCDREVSLAFKTDASRLPDFKKCLLTADTSLKTCAMALIPELRNNEDILLNMTFGVMEKDNLKNELDSSRKKYANKDYIESATENRINRAYNKYKNSWKDKTISNIAELVRDEEAMALMSNEAKLDYALALDSYYRNNTTLVEGEEGKRVISEAEKQLIDDTLLAWKKELGCEETEPLDAFVANKFVQTANTLNDEWLTNEVNLAITEYNKTENPSKQEIEKFKEVERTTTESRKVKERTEQVGKIEDDTAEMFGEFFQKEHISQEIEEIQKRKEQGFLVDKVNEFNKKYSLRVSGEKLDTAIREISMQMVQAREEKERFLGKNAVVVIEDGKETCYDAKEYFKEFIDDINKTYQEELKKLEDKKALVKKERETALETVNKNKNASQADIDELKAGLEKIYNDKDLSVDKEMEKLSNVLAEQLSTAQGGIVIEKDGNTQRRYKNTEYYETHETKKEQVAYGEYQKKFSRCFKDACKNVKEQNYLNGKTTDFSVIAKDVDNMFKSALYVADVYSDEKNTEFVQKCNLGGFSVEQLSGFATETDDTWALNQSSEKAWTKQATQAKKILSAWTNAEKTDKSQKPAARIKKALDNRRQAFKDGKISRKELLDYMVAADAHLQKNYPSRFSKIWSFVQYNREKDALDECRVALRIKMDASLRIAMNAEYVSMSKQMTKEQIFKSIEKTSENSLNFKDEKAKLDGEHKEFQDKVIADKEAEFNRLIQSDREPIIIESLNERNNILLDKPRVQPIQDVAQLQQNLNLQQHQ